MRIHYILSYQSYELGGPDIERTKEYKLSPEMKKEEE